MQPYEYVKIQLWLTYFVAVQDTARKVLLIPEHYPITLECAIPDVNQTLKWSEKDKIRYSALLERADEKNYISGRNVADTMLKRNRYMVDKSDIVIAVFNGIEKGGTWYTIKYAKKKKIELIDLCKIS